MNSDNTIYSVGIDIGTTTMSMIISVLHIANTALSYMVPDIAITEKEIIYKSPLYLTPFTDRETLNGEAIRQIITREYEKAQIRPDQIETGAVIITGEAALKKNADIIAESMSSLAGEFVVSTAGPNLESVISGKGSGAEKFSRKNACCIANCDIGGGTTNISVFSGGELKGQTCIDVGGRLLKYDQNGKVTYVSGRLNDLLAVIGDRIEEGNHIDENTLLRIGELLAKAIIESVEGRDTELSNAAITNTSETLRITERIDQISFSGGVADCYYDDERELSRYLDIGPAIARGLHRLEEAGSIKVFRPEETIRATVIGAGVHITEVSGSTISYSGIELPLKNLPVFVPSKTAEQNIYIGNIAPIIAEMRAFMSERDISQATVYLKGKSLLSYKELCVIAEIIKEIAQELIGEGKPLVVICENDMAKALGQRLRRILREDKSVICLDKIRVGFGDYIDIGKPIMNNMVIPVVVKTLIFGM